MKKKFKYKNGLNCKHTIRVSPDDEVPYLRDATGRWFHTFNQCCKSGTGFWSSRI